jgi:Flp pilus assembly protein TadG
MANPDSIGHRNRLIRLLERCAGIGGSTGGSIIEIALLVPVFTVLIVGSAEFAGLEYAAIETSNAARAGVAYGAQSSTTAADTAGMQNAAVNDSPNVAGLVATAKEFWSCSATPSTQHTSPPTCTGTGTGNHVLNYVEVTTTATVTPEFHLPGLPSSYTLTGQAIMRVQ